MEAELEAALARKRYERRRRPETSCGNVAGSEVSGHRHAYRERSLIGTFGVTTVGVPRARLATPTGGTKGWRSLFKVG